MEYNINILYRLCDYFYMSIIEDLKWRALKIQSFVCISFIGDTFYCTIYIYYKQTKKQTNQQTNQPTNKPTNQQTNKPTNKNNPKGVCCKRFYLLIADQKDEVQFLRAPLFLVFLISISVSSILEQDIADIYIRLRVLGKNLH